MKYKFEHFSFFVPLLAMSLLCLLTNSCGNQKFLRSHSESTERPRKRVFDEHMVVKNKLNFVKQSYKIQEDYDNLWYEISTIVQQNPDRSVVKGFRQWVHHLNDTLSFPYRYNKKEKSIKRETVRRKGRGQVSCIQSRLDHGTAIAAGGWLVSEQD